MKSAFDLNVSSILTSEPFSQFSIVHGNDFYHLKALSHRTVDRVVAGKVAARVSDGRQVPLRSPGLVELTCMKHCVQVVNVLANFFVDINLFDILFGLSKQFTAEACDRIFRAMHVLERRCGSAVCGTEHCGHPNTRLIDGKLLRGGLLRERLFEHCSQRFANSRLTVEQQLLAAFAETANPNASAMLAYPIGHAWA